MMICDSIYYLSFTRNSYILFVILFPDSYWVCIVAVLPLIDFVPLICMYTLSSCTVKIFLLWTSLDLFHSNFYHKVNICIMHF